MKNVQLLDCTLRDGGRVIDCSFPDQDICDITRELTAANIDIVEIGFLRSRELVEYKGNTTFFTSTKQMEAFIPDEHSGTDYVAFVDFDMYDFSVLEKCDGKSINGIRFGFTKKQFDTRKVELIECMNKIKQQGYHLFVQGVNTPAYSDKELLELIDLMNEIKPYSFGIVDTYGSMYLEDINHYYNVVDYNLNKEVNINVHSHNNFQLSFAFAQEIISLSEGKRNIILDATLNGMGKCAGNLNTELVVDYLTRKKGYAYKLDEVLDIIDNYLYKVKQKTEWGYSVPAFMAGIYKSHPNNVIYLSEKFRINTKDIKNIISMIDEDTRQRYDYDNIEKLYIKYNEDGVSDIECISKLKKITNNKKILLLVPGSTLISEQDKVKEYIRKEAPVIVSVNFVSDYDNSYTFWGNPKRYYKEKSNKNTRSDDIICSNVEKSKEGLCVIDYHRLICEGYRYFDNSAIMCLNLLKVLRVENIAIAGFDGFEQEKHSNYMNESFFNNRYIDEFDDINKELYCMLKEFSNDVKDFCKIEFLTQSKIERAIL